MKTYDLRDDNGNHYTITEREETVAFPIATYISDVKEIATDYGEYDLEQCGKLSKIKAVLFCFFLGFLGAHKFYEGKKGMGILYIFTGGLFAIGMYVDLIVILAHEGKYYDPDDKPSGRQCLIALGKVLGVLAIWTIITMIIVSFVVEPSR